MQKKLINNESLQKLVQEQREEARADNPSLIEQAPQKKPRTNVLSREAKIEVRNLVLQQMIGRS